MEPQRFRIAGGVFAAGDGPLQDALAAIYDTEERPRCMCIPCGVPMYIAKHRQFVIKRMPEGGPSHDPTCPSFEPEPGTSGLGELLGKAVIAASPESVELKVGFPLSHGRGRAVARDRSSPTQESHAPRHGMSLRAVLHFLYERAGFNRWYPAMEGMRNQGVLCKYLSQAAQEIRIKGECLDDRLYIPEPFDPAARDEIAKRRREKLSFLATADDAERFKLAVVVGEFKAVEPASFARRVWIRHMPDAPLLVDEDTWNRAMRVYGPLLQARTVDAERKPRILMAALVYAKREQTYAIDALSLMLTTNRWIPVEAVHELPLIERLCEQRRAFLKPLRYDARSSTSFPNVLLLDALDKHGKPMPLHVASALASPKERAAKERAIQALGRNAWVWRTDGKLPELPTATRRTPRAVAAEIPEASADCGRSASSLWSPATADSPSGSSNSTIGNNDQKRAPLTRVTR